MSEYTAIYTPKGSMCANCVNCLSDCSFFNFKGMKVFKDCGAIVIVVCSEFKTKFKTNINQ